MAPPGLHYKVKLSSGRILGPLDLLRIRLLIQKNQIIGTEIAREYPAGDWKDINLIPKIAEMLIAHASGVLKGRLFPFGGEREDFVQTELLPEAAVAVSISSEELEPTSVMSGFSAEVPSMAEESHKITPQVEDDEETATQLVPSGEAGRTASLVSLDHEDLEPTAVIDRMVGPPKQRISEERTVVFQRPVNPIQALSRKKLGSRSVLQWLIIVITIGVIAQDFLAPKENRGEKIGPIRPQLPAYSEGKTDPTQSAKAYAEAMPFYLADHVVGYRRASEKFLQAANFDINNVKALALLASCYLNLIDSSNKDENYFSTVLKLIEMSRAKVVDLPETVVADAEYYMTVNRAESAQIRVVEYTKLHRNFDPIMFYYLAFAFYQRGDARSAATFIAKFPDDKIFSPKVYYLRGLISEKLGDESTAIEEYKKAIRLNKDHMRSRLRITELLNSAGVLEQAAPELEAITHKPTFLSPRELARAYYLHAQLLRNAKKWDLALADIERAVKLEKGNSDYLLELYTLRAKSGESLKSVQKEARMYFFLGEGQRQLKEGNHQEALSYFLQARHVNIDSHLPLVKIGDMFFYLNDIANARMNYEIAAKKVPTNIEVWSKYINVLILSFDWEEAQKAMERFRMLPVSQSAIDKAAGDMYGKQGRHREAQAYYKKAMARDIIDPEVYIAYARSLMVTKNYKEAPSFLTLSLERQSVSLHLSLLSARSRC